MKRLRSLLLAAGALLGVLALLAENRILPYRPSPRRAEMLEAASLMRAAEAAVREARLAAGLSIDRVSDPNATGLIGLEHSEITTTLGELEAKRTCADPDMAALLVRLLAEAGAGRGDAIAVGASGSFPGATLAVLAAARALGLRVAIMASLGASSWGANIPGFSYLSIHEAARRVLGYELLGASLGGDDDSGDGMPEEGRRALLAEAAARGVRLMEPRGLAESLRLRMAAYDGFVGQGRYAAFVNIGGASANLGEGAGSLGLEPGLNPGAAAGLAAEGGVIRAMAERGVPLVHILNIRRLAAEGGLDWDRAPYGAPGESRVYRDYDRSARAIRLACLLAAYLACLGALALCYRAAASRAKRRAGGGQPAPRGDRAGRGLTHRP